MATSIDPDCDPVIKHVVVFYDPVTPPVCERPIDLLEITSPLDNEILHTSDMTVEGIVEPFQHVDLLQVRVNGGTWVNIPFSGPNWSTQVTLVP